MTNLCPRLPNRRGRRLLGLSIPLREHARLHLRGTAFKFFLAHRANCINLLGSRDTPASRNTARKDAGVPATHVDTTESRRQPFAPVSPNKTADRESVLYWHSCGAKSQFPARNRFSLLVPFCRMAISNRLSKFPAFHVAFSINAGASLARCGSAGRPSGQLTFRPVWDSLPIYKALPYSTHSILNISGIPRQQCNSLRTLAEVPHGILTNPKA